ncbi:hypothetical protein ACFL2R_01960 [Patescibacteria group bacterium]
MLSLLNIAHAGAIDEAPGIAEVLLNVLDFLLQIFGFLGIIALVIAGFLYFTAAGDQGRIDLAKKMTIYVVIGVVVALGSMVIVRQITGFFLT